MTEENIVQLAINTIPGGRNLHFGVREHAMGAIVNGLSLSKLRGFGATFFVFIDYARQRFSRCCKADTAREVLRKVLKRLAKREVLKYLPDHDPRAFESRLAVADLWVGDDILSKLDAARLALRSHPSLNPRDGRSNRLLDVCWGWTRSD